MNEGKSGDKLLDGEIFYTLSTKRAKPLKWRNIVSFRAIVTLLCGCLAALAVATSLNASEFKGPASFAQSTAAGSLLVAATNTCAYNSTTKRCGGTCPHGQTCVKKSGNECKCEPPVTYTCKYNSKTKTCGGTCPLGRTCKKVTVNICTCQ